MTMKLSISLFISVLALQLNAQAPKTCCSTVDLSPQALASNADFKRDHEAPMEFTLASPIGKMITYKASDGKAGNAYVVPSPEPSNQVVFLFHEWWGLNDYIKQEAEKWQQELGNVTVYAVDLYEGKVATTPEDAAKYMGEMDANHARASIEGLMRYIGNDKSVATIGWCLGGTWSFEAALIAGNAAKGCVMYYGFPEEDAQKIKQLKTDVLYIYGNQDAYITRAAVDGLSANVKSAGQKMKLVSYDAVHAFANPSNPKFNEYAASEAHYEASKYLKNALSK
jgi:carboxymethylenebutenolidase